MSRSEHGAAGSPVSETSPSLFSGLSLVCPRDVGATAGRAGVAEAAEAAEEAAEAAAEGEEPLLVFRVVRWTRPPPVAAFWLEKKLEVDLGLGGCVSLRHTSRALCSA